MIKEKIRISDVVIDRLINMMEIVRDAQFVIGDELNLQIKLHKGQKSAVINYVAGYLNVSASTLYDYARVARIWKPKYREEFQALDWTIYRNSDPEKDRALLEQAVEEGWNSSRFKEHKFPVLVEPASLLGRAVSYVKKAIEIKTLDRGLQSEIIAVMGLLQMLIERLEGSNGNSK